MALNAAKQRAADAGIDLNFAKLMTQEMPPDEENFAACLEAIETIGHFPDLLPEFNGLTPHFEQQSAAPRYRNFGYAVSADYSFNFDPRKSSHEVGCREILRLLNGWDAELARISEASKRKHYVINKNWASPADEISTPTDHNVAKTFHLRAMARLVIGDNKGAVSDLETMLRVGRHFDEKPTMLNLLVCSVRMKYSATTLWESLNRCQFDQSDLNQLANAFILIEAERVWNKSCVAEGAFAVAAFESFIKGAASRYSKSTDTFYGASYFYADPLVDQTIDDDVITLTNRLIFAFLPTGWFRQNLAEKIDADINLFQQQGTMIEPLSFVDSAVFKNGKYNFIFGEVVAIASACGNSQKIHRFLRNVAPSKSRYRIRTPFSRTR